MSTTEPITESHRQVFQRAIHAFVQSLRADTSLNTSLEQAHTLALYAKELVFRAQDAAGDRGLQYRDDLDHRLQEIREDLEAFDRACMVR